MMRLQRNNSLEAAAKKGGQRVSAWLTIGGVLLAMWLPPVFAILIARRWRDVPKYLRVVGVLLSFCILPAIVWAELGSGTLHGALSEFAFVWPYYLTWTLFSICYMRHRRIRSSWLLRLGAGFISLVFVVVTVITCRQYLCLESGMRAERLLDAAYNGDLSVVRQLLDSGANANVKGKWNLTPIHFAANTGHLEVVKLLVSAGADVNGRTTNGWTPLHYAAKYGDKEVVRYLLGNGGVTDAREADDKMPLDIAKAAGHEDVFALLEKYRYYEPDDQAKTDEGASILDVPYIRQKGLKDCGPTVISMLMKYHDLDHDYDAMSRQVMWDANVGSHPHTIHEYLEGAGARPVIFYPTAAFHDQLKKFLSLGRPILVLQEFIRDGARSVHLCLVIGFSELSGAYYLHDPYYGARKRIRADVFDRRWVKGGGLVRVGLVLSSDEAAELDNALYPNRQIAAPFERGRLLMEQGKNAEAVEEFQKVIKLVPEFVPAYLWLGSCYARLEEWRRAEDVFAKAVTMDEDYYWSLGKYKIGGAQCQNDKLKDAARALTEFVNSQPWELAKELGTARRILKALKEAE